LDGPVNDLFNGVGEDPSTGTGKCCFWGKGQRNVTHTKNVVLLCGVDVSYPYVTGQ